MGEYPMTPTPIAELTPQIASGNEHFLLYGEPGTGKTHCALTIPEPIYFLSCGSINELKTYYSKTFQDKHGKKEIYVDIAKENYVDGVFKGAVAMDQVSTLLDDALEGDAKGTGPQFRSIIIDNATQVTDFQLNKVTEIAYMGVKQNPKKEAGAEEKTSYWKYAEHGIFAPQDSDWGAAQSIMRKWQSWMMGVEKNFVFVAHEYHEMKKIDRHTQEIVGIYPLFIGQDRDRIANYFDNVWQMSIVGGAGKPNEPSIATAARTVEGTSPVVIAKTRIGGLLPRDYLNPNLSDVIKKFKEHVTSVGAK